MKKPQQWRFFNAFHRIEGKLLPWIFSILAELLPWIFSIFDKLLPWIISFFWHKTLKNMFICFIAICDERIEKGISFRMIQAYEQGGQDITKAEERRVFALARTLGVWGGGDLRVM